MAGKPGRSGRKPKAEKYARPIAAAEKRIADHLPFIIDRLFELAEGVTVQETGSDGKERIYTRAPDYRAASYLVDRLMGKPAQSIEAEVSGPGGGPIPVTGYEILPPRGANDDGPGGGG